MKLNLIIAGAVVTCLGIGYNVMSFTSSGFGDSTGAPVPGGVVPAYTSCAQSGCHSGNPINDSRGTTTISSDIPAAGWVPGNRYKITIRSTFPNRDAFGWQAMVWGSGDQASVGTISVSSGSRGVITQSILRRGGVIVDTNRYFTHNPGTVVSPTIGINEVSFDWVAPSDVQNESVTVYASVNAANGNGNNLGDNIFIANATYPSARLVNLGGKLEKQSMGIYPNPATDMVTIKGEALANQNADVQVYNQAGKLQFQTHVLGNETEERKLNVASLSPGLYFVKVIPVRGKAVTLMLNKH